MRGGRLDGFIPHTVFWHEGAGWRRAPFYATHSVRGNRATAHIQTPVLALAWELVAERSADDPGFAGEALDALRLHYDWLGSHRDPDGDGLISIIHPDESGLDDSPKYDEVFGWMSHYLPGHFWLVERSRRLRLFRCWRGPSWMNTVWLLVPALRRFGYDDEADRIVGSCIALVERHGFREYYNPLNGEGLAARRFGWSTLLIDLLGDSGGGPQLTSETPFVGSLGGELRSMGVEAASETARRLNRRAAAAARRLRPG
jgi:hypothetical protein